MLDSIQDLRIFYKQTHLLEKKEHYDNYKDREHRRKTKCKLMGEKYSREKYVAPQQKLANGETISQVLHRSRTLLFKHKRDWSRSQQQRAEVLFEKIPELQIVYDQVIKFRNWYSKGNIGKPIAQLRKKLSQWYKEVDKLDIIYLNNAKSTIERNEGIILNYFYDGHSNAKAETLNSHISRFIGKTFGIRDLEYFFYRLAIYFA